VRITSLCETMYGDGRRADSMTGKPTRFRY
jgi:hypothetical protein